MYVSIWTRSNNIFFLKCKDHNILLQSNLSNHVFYSSFMYKVAKRHNLQVFATK
jgi:hypothetical protein